MNHNVSAVSAQRKSLKLKGFTTIDDVTASVITLVSLTLLVYFPVLSHQFQTHWDDQWVVINPYTENGLNAQNLWAILTEFYKGQYAPLNQLSYTLLYSAFGYNPFWFHLTGVMLHLCNVLLVYFFIRKILIQSENFKPVSITRISFFTATVMAVHPLLVESVAWISASKILVYSCWYLVGLHCYLKYLSTSKIKYYLFSIFFFILSFGGKEQAVTFPVCLLLVDYAVNRHLKNKRVWLEKAPMFVLAFGMGYITLLSQSADKVGLLSNTRHYPFYQNIIFASYSTTEYLVKCLIPVKLSYLYVFPNAIGEEVPIRFWMYPLLLLIILFSFRDFWQKRWVFFGIAFFLIHIGMVLHIIPMSRFAIVADRYAYIASIGIFFLVAFFVDKALENTKYRTLTVTLAFVYTLAIGVYAHQHSKVWRNSDTLKQELKDQLEKRNDLQANNPSK
ncbi:hypothetical protein ACTJJ0_26710 [Chitinophaga sp. 22321]|uniref:Dolichyl-phosphate-mannose-protein mannosyltransferase n=1 Tax=Chitinophaga hostae TaxID=2831022 RepID=A0ABS5J6M4_9BACT|nr:hypothetical protein [Chitinophaga hostae]MBS0030703.1 hypothetical protein [Chitinophaga hostae]